ncbi:MAG: ABC transporter permease subunit [Acidimicrobiia bacterium]|nr:ABC transporter permease subunit [Acidimicrobiia bacterium]
MRLTTAIIDKRYLVGFASLGAGLVLWDVYARTLGDPVFIPTIPDIAGAFVDLVGDQEFWSSYATTLEPFLIGWLTALVVGIPFGLLMGRSRVVTGLTMPELSFVSALPISTIVPVVVILFGIDLVARSTVVFLFAIVEIVFTTASGVRYIDKDLYDMGDTFGLSRLKRFTRITLPGATAGIAAAIRVGTGRAVVGMVVMELLLVSVGVGRLISRYKDAFEASRLYAVVLSLAIFALAVQAILRSLERRALKWRGA